MGSLRVRHDFSFSCIGEGNGNPLQYSCLKSPRDREAWWATVYGVAQGRTRLKCLSSSTATLQCWVSFYCTAKWISCMYTYSKSPIYEQVLFWKHIPKSTVFISPAKLAYIHNFPGGSDGKSQSAMWETWVWSLGWEDSLEEGTATHSSILVWRIPWTVWSMACKESDTTERLPQCPEKYTSTVQQLAYTCLHLWKFTAWRCVCREITMHPFFKISIPFRSPQSIG